MDVTEPTPMSRLEKLAQRITADGLGGFNECIEITNLSLKIGERYLELLGAQVSLFHKKELWDTAKRRKFLDRIHDAHMNLANAYFPESNLVEHDGLFEKSGLSHHPSSRIRTLAKRVYVALEEHWQCDCHHRTVRQARAKVARLSLIRHRELAPRTNERDITGSNYCSASFEVLLPVNKDDVTWKATNVQVLDPRYVLSRFL
jgi:hypothetical protein